VRDKGDKIQLVRGKGDRGLILRKDERREKRGARV